MKSILQMKLVKINTAWRISRS